MMPRQAVTPFEAYKLFMAIKTHFTNPKFDYFQYNGKVAASISAFEQRRDRYQFAKLARLKDPQSYLVANFVAGSPKWIGDVLSDDSEKIYTDWLRRIESLTYLVTREIKQLDDDFISFFKVKDGQHPRLLKLHLQGKISIETLVILNDLLRFFPIWDKKINDTVIWPSVRDRCLKYRQFLHYDRAKIKPLVKDLMAGETSNPTQQHTSNT